MDLHLNMALAEHYRSSSQKARKLTEGWVTEHMYCPRCGHQNLKHLPNGRPVRDFVCLVCGNIYELKSTKRSFGCRVADGAYNTMMNCIADNHNPDFLLMRYSLETESVRDLTLIPKHFIVPSVIERRKKTERLGAAGWVGRL